MLCFTKLGLEFSKGMVWQIWEGEPIFCANRCCKQQTYIAVVIWSLLKSIGWLYATISVTNIETIGWKYSKIRKFSILHRFSNFCRFLNFFHRFLPIFSQIFCDFSIFLPSISIFFSIFLLHLYEIFSSDLPLVLKHHGLINLPSFS